MSFNTYGKNEKSTGARFQVWAEVAGVKHGGGVIDATAFANYPVGSVIPAGTPVHLDKSGGTLTPVLLYEVIEDVTAQDTTVLVKGFQKPAATGNVIIVPAAIGGTGKGVAYSAVSDEGNSFYKLTIVADALGEVSAGTILAKADGAGLTGKKVDDEVVPNGLLWHDIVKEEGDTWATGAVVDVGRILEDRIVGVPAAYKAVLPGIKFEKGI